MKNLLYILGCCSVVIGAINGVSAGIAVRFEAPEYTVNGSGEFTVRVVIDGDDQVPGFQPIANGLFHFGVKVSFTPAQVETNRESLEVVATLDYSGLVPGAAVEIGDGFLSSKGNIILSTPTSQPFLENILFALTFANRAPVGSQYELQLSSAASLPSETLFLDGKGKPLDDTVTFGSGSVTVLPDDTFEPPLLDIRFFPPHSVELLYSVEVGRDYFIEISEDLVAWENLFQVPRNDGSVLVEITPGPKYFRLKTFGKQLPDSNSCCDPSLNARL